LPAGDLLVAVDAEERSGPTGRQSGGNLVVRLAVAIEADWLLDLVPAGLADSEETLWNPDRQRVEVVAKLGYGAVVLDETRRPAPPSPAASRLLADAALSAGMAGPGNEGSSPSALQVKLELLRGAFPELPVPQFGEGHLRELLLAACEGLTSMVELAASPMEERLRNTLPPVVVGHLRSETPDRIPLGAGRQVPVNYEAGKPPWIESRLQDFFGMRAGPTICRGRVPLTLHLLAPNQRAVQVTSDLAGFWQKHYPAIRKELSRRYPRHAWPEDGATATPPPPRPPRRP
jgi:ATP-dependent helicase HrpB